MAEDLLEPKSKTKRLPPKVQQRADLGRLWLVTVRTVSKHIRADDLESKCGDTDPHYWTCPVSFALEADSLNNDTSRT